MRAKLLLLPLIAGLCAMPVTAQAYTYKVIHHFCSKRQCKDGSLPEAGLIAGADGTLYGTTTQATGSGNIFALTPSPSRSRWNLHVLYNFSHFDALRLVEGERPSWPLVLDSSGNLYGANAAGGPGEGGTLFELVANGRFGGRELKVLSSFASADPHAANASSGLAYRGQASGALYDGTSPLYGSTGSVNGGSIYRLTRSGDVWTRDSVHDFCSLAHCRDGGAPRDVLVDDGGDVLGATVNGGTENKGTVFRLTRSGGSWDETVLRSFCRKADCRNGENPFGVTIDAPGDFFGVAGFRRPPNEPGLIFKLGRDGAYEVLYRFCSLGDCRDGATVFSAPVVGATGTLFGVTIDGGGNNGDLVHRGGGTVYALNGTTLETLHAFCAERDCRDGVNPMGQLVIDADGNLFGVTNRGGDFNAGVVFELSP